MALFVPDIQCLLKVFETGNVGIAQAMSGPGVPRENLDPNLPGFANFERTIFKGLQKPFDPQLTMVKAIGGLISAGTEFPGIAAKYSVRDPAKVAKFLADKLVKPAAEGPKLIKKFVPPTTKSITDLLLSPIQQHMVLPETPPIVLPFAGLNISLPKLGVTGPAAGLPSIPLLPGPFGVLMPPNLGTVVGIITMPITILLDFFGTVVDFFKAIIIPAKMPKAISDVLKLPSKLLPTIDTLKTAIGLPEFPAPMIDFIKRAFDALINLFKVMFGLPGGKCPVE